MRNLKRNIKDKRRNLPMEKDAKGKIIQKYMGKITTSGRK